MKHTFKKLFSLQLTAILLVIYGVSIAVATFIENDFGTTAAKAVIYNSKWFELIMGLLFINLIGNMLTRKLYRKRKLTIFIFHIAFAIIIVGSFITRYIGSEGIMHIREGAQSNMAISSETYLQISVSNGKSEKMIEKKVLLSPLTAKGFSTKINTDNKTFKISSVDFIPNAVHSLVSTEDGEAYLEIVTSSGHGRKSIHLKRNAQEFLGEYSIAFGDSNGPADINIIEKGEKLYILANQGLSYTNMFTSNDSVLAPGEYHPLEVRALYKIGGRMFVLSNYLKSAELILSSASGQKNTGMPSAIVLMVESGTESKQVTLFGQPGAIGRKQSVNIEDYSLGFSYGAKAMQVPFYLKLNDFRLERYPGSNSPSSFESTVDLIDAEKGIHEEREIFMNNVLKHRGYRFYQSSYDRDEQGTILSVNKDFYGTFVTYIGYLLLSLGMFLSLFNKNSRFRMLSKSISAVFIVALLSHSGLVKAQTNDNLTNEYERHSISKDHARELETLLILDAQGRIKPLSTYSSEILRKVARKEGFHSLSPTQVLGGMLAYPSYWQNVPMIKVSHDKIKDLIGIKGKYGSFNDIVYSKTNNTYPLKTHVEAAYRKKPANRSKFDNEIIRLDERVNICYIVYTYSLLKIFPLPESENNTWVSPIDSLYGVNEEEKLFISSIIPMYLKTIDKAQQSGDWSVADEYLGYIKKFQERYGSRVLVSSRKTKLEVWYNNFNIFDRIANYYGLLGFVLLIYNFVLILKQREKKSAWIINRAGSAFIILVFVAHTAGLIIRWYISGHAPWSNGYEALIYISWGVVLAGIFFMKNSNVVLPLAAILSFLILHVAHLSFMDPEITPLVPVLKSAWLVIHVAVITISYAFLGLGALLAITNLIVMVFRNKENSIYLNSNIRLLSEILEMTLIIGLYLLTIGTFLGGVWANESWGRYWAWDPKETWALVTVLVYAFILHMRLIPGLKGYFALNLMSMIGFWSVIMTYFGVNYYLAGLHSYAKGDPLPVPDFIIYTLIAQVLLAVGAYINEARGLKEKVHSPNLKEKNISVSNHK